MIAEAEAFDRLLDMAPALAPARVAALSDRIMAQAAHTPRIAVSRELPVARPKPASIWKRHSAGISALAASLVIGLLAGQNATVAPAVSEIASVVGIDTMTDAASDGPAQLAATDEVDLGLDGDLL